MERTLSTLASELLHRLPTMSEEERRLGLEIYRQLARGEPASTSSLAEAMRQSSSVIAELLERPNLKCLTYLDTERSIIRRWPSLESSNGLENTTASADERWPCGITNRALYH